MTAVVQVDGLSKRYRSGFRSSVQALCNVDFELTEDAAGQIHGLIGPNGSGKTTLIRCLLGLVRPTSGSVSVLGVNSSDGHPDVCRQVGSLLDEPSFFPSFGARLNLQILADIHGIPRVEVDSVLDQVGLLDRADHPFKTYSRGMRQRLGIAAVILRRPKLVVLDEPTNGLDPLASRQLWSTLRSMADHGTSILVSSHNLADLERGCSHAVIVNKGRIVDYGTVEEITTRFGTSMVSVEVRDAKKASTILMDSGYRVIDSIGNTLTVEVEEVGAEAVNQALAERGVFARGLTYHRPSLEESFVRLTGSDDRNV